MQPIDLRSARWVCFGDPARTLLFAFAGGYWLRDGAGSRFEHAPVAGVIGAWMLPSQGFVASRLGLVYRWDRWPSSEGRWTVIEAPFLEDKTRATVWSEGERLFIDDGADTYEWLAEGWTRHSILPAPVRFATRDDLGLILASETTIHRVNLATGEDEVLHAEGDRPGEGRRILDVCVARGGGLLVIDDAGTLVHVSDEGEVEVRHVGAYSRSLRHVYPDPEPDAVVDIDQIATLLPSGEALSIRRGYGRLGGEPRLLPVPDRFRPLVRGLGSAPSVEIEGFDGGELLLRTGGVLNGVYLGRPPGELRRTSLSSNVNGEVFDLDGRGVRVVTSSETLHLPLATAPRWLLEEWDEARAPMVLDVEGGLHRFDGVRYARILSTGGYEPARHARGIGARLFLVGETWLWSDRLPDAANASCVSGAAEGWGEGGPLTDPELLEALLAPAPRDLVVRRLPSGRTDVRSNPSSRLHPVGRVAAGRRLCALMGGGAEEAVLAARVMAGLDSRTQFLSFEVDGELHGWIAMEAQSSLLIVDDRFCESLGFA